jgi:hypothetical protein
LKRTTSTLLAGALTAGTVAVLSVGVPGVASAEGCGSTDIDQSQYGPGKLFDTAAPVGPTGAGATNELAAAHPVGAYVSSTGPKAATYVGVGSIPLAEQTAQSNYALALTDATGVKPGYQLVMDLNGAADGGFTVLVYEDVYQTPGREGTWWSTGNRGDGPTIHHEGGHGSTAWATLAEWQASYPDAVINAFGFSLGSGVTGSAVVDSITFGCNVFDLGYVNGAPTAAFTATSTSTPGQWSFDGTGSSDPDGDTLTYAWDFGDGQTGNGATVTHTYATGGPKTVVLTVTDPGNLSDTESKSVTVVAGGTAQGDELPFTGADVLGLAAVGALALGAGAAGLVVSRKRRTTA